MGPTDEICAERVNERSAHMFGRVALTHKEKRNKMAERQTENKVERQLEIIFLR